MPATTTKGYPYPLGTDRVADGDDAIHALAEKVDTALGVIAGGQANITHSGTGTASTTVTFPVGRFVSPPTAVLVGAALSTIAGVLEGGGSASGVSASGFTANYYRSAGNGTMTVVWLAVLI